MAMRGMSYARFAVAETYAASLCFERAAFAFDAPPFEQLRRIDVSEMSTKAHVSTSWGTITAPI
jgi:hypothetical protein